MCDRCISYLASRLNNESSKILLLLNDNIMNNDQIIKKTNLSYSITQSTLRRLEGAGFINVKNQGRKSIYYLTKSGQRLIEMYKMLKGEKIN